ncbi:CBS domain containing-hemolysin-like protein [Blastococcus colisei]|uniref:CBS domain containing-hemolysin-like protein n=1 Tax=Blastococcus colisei TaxID=1564162 RepID=A0A543P1L0_9ACTN|nr:hemolysin family protein [Blastococcus colisei]TQN38005.1 CBS domain containing-hemolysin-like protein [Blastococcus colisei]
MLTEWLLLAFAVALIAANALFVAAEFSLITVDRATVDRAAESGDGRAGSLQAAMRTLSTQLSGCQLGITVTSLVVGFIAEPSLATLFRGPLGLTGLPDGAVVGISVGLALLVATCLQMVFGELVPKNWAIAEPMRVGRVVAGPQRAFTAATRPLISFLNGTANAILRLFGITPTEELASARAPQELVSLVSRSGRAGTLDAATAELVARSIAFGDRTAADAMTPRPRVRFLMSGQPVADLIAAAASSGHARFPVQGESVDDIVGFVHFKHALGVEPARRGETTVADVMVPAAAVPATMELDPLLGVLREGLQMAVVVDEYGGTAGIVTLEDLIEEIVGEIADEQDAPARRQHRAADGSWILSGLLRPDEAGALVGLDLPEAEESDTLGGLLTERLGRLPDVGDAVLLSARDLERTDDDGLPTRTEVQVTVTRLDGRRVDRLRLRRNGGATAARRMPDTADASDTTEARP